MLRSTAEKNDGFAAQLAPVGRETVQDRVYSELRRALISGLFDQGLGDRILVSHDVCSCTRMTHFGGHGYGHLLRNGPVLMRRAGLSSDDIDRLLRRNPLRLLTLAPHSRAGIIS